MQVTRIFLLKNSFLFQLKTKKIATILKAGTIVVPAKYFIEIIKKMPSDIAIKSKNEQIIKIQSEEITLSLNGFPADEFRMYRL